MIPSTFLGLAVAAAGLAPGWVFVRVEERRRPRRDQSQLFEAVELLFVGALATGFTALAALVVAEQAGWLDASELADGGTDYLLARPGATLAFGLVTFGLATGLAWLAARLIFRSFPASIQPVSAWHRILADEPGVSPYVIATLKSGIALAGDVAGYTVDDRDADERELLLAEPELRAVGASVFVPVREQYVILRGEEIATLSVVRYKTVTPLQLAPLQAGLASQAVFLVAVGSAGVAAAAVEGVESHAIWGSLVVAGIVGLPLLIAVSRAYGRFANFQTTPRHRAVIEQGWEIVFRRLALAIAVAAALAGASAISGSLLLVLSGAVVSFGLAALVASSLIAIHAKRQDVTLYRESGRTVSGRALYSRPRQKVERSVLRMLLPR